MDAASRGLFPFAPRDSMLKSSSFIIAFTRFVEPYKQACIKIVSLFGRKLRFIRNGFSDRVLITLSSDPSLISCERSAKVLSISCLSNENLFEFFWVFFMFGVFCNLQFFLTFLFFVFPHYLSLMCSFYFPRMKSVSWWSCPYGWLSIWWKISVYATRRFVTSFPIQFGVICAYALK